MAALALRATPWTFDRSVFATGLDGRVEDANDLASLFCRHCQLGTAFDDFGDISIVRIPMSADGGYPVFVQGSVGQWPPEHALMLDGFRGLVDVACSQSFFLGIDAAFDEAALG